MQYDDVGLILFSMHLVIKRYETSQSMMTCILASKATKRGGERRGAQCRRCGLLWSVNYGFMKEVDISTGRERILWKFLSISELGDCKYYHMKFCLFKIRFKAISIR